MEESLTLMASDGGRISEMAMVGGLLLCLELDAHLMLLSFAHV